MTSTPLVSVLTPIFNVEKNITNEEIGKIEIFEQIKYPYHISYEEMDKYRENN